MLGDLVAGRFELEREAGSGGMGTVWRARDRATGATVALKLMSAEADAERFTREAEVLRRIQHPGVVAYVAHGRADSGEPYLAMEWLEGEDLADRLRRGGISAPEAVDLVGRAASALGAAHGRGIVHRDVKPSNLFLPGGSLARVKVLDFGVARLHQATRALTQSGAVMGTPEYMAPEQARGDRDVDARADVFALGCVLFACLTGRPPFTGEHFMAVLVKIALEEAPLLRDFVPDAPRPLEDLVARMLSKDPRQRPPDGAAVAAEIAALGEIGELRPVPATERPPALTAGEQRVLSVVLVAAPRDPARHADATLDASAAGDLDALRAAAVGSGRFERMADGSAVVMLASAGAITDQARRAARCALAMRAARGDAPIAVATGRAILSGRWPLGEVVDKAVQLVRRETPASPVDPARPGLPIAIDELTARLLDGRFRVTSDATSALLLGEDDAISGERRLLGKPTPCVGRESELGLLGAAFEACRSEPEARAVLVTGAAGAGKSRIAREALRRIGEQAAVWTASGDPMGAGSAFAMMGRVVRAAIDLRDGEPIEDRRHKLLGRLAPRIAPGDVDRVSVFLGELAGTSFSDDEHVQLRAARRDAMLMGDQIRRAFEDWLAAETGDRPVLLVLDDLHHGDLPSVRLVDAALRRLADRPLFVLALARPEVKEVFPDLWSERGLQQIHLGPLKPRACEKLVREALGAGASAETVARLVERADGNAFWLEELIRATAEGRGDSAPETLLAMAQARLESLEPEARRVLRAASVFGPVFWSHGVEALLGGPEAAPETGVWLSSLCEREVVERRGASRIAGEVEHAFRNALVRDAAYGMLTDEDRPLAHRLAGQWLERSGEGDALVLAEHFDRGGQPGRAVLPYLRAAEQALEGNDLAGAIDRAERGVRCGAGGEALGSLRRIQAEAHRWRGETARAADRGREAMEHLPRGSAAWCAAAVESTFGSSRLGALDRMEEVARAVEEALADGSVAPSGLAAVAHVVSVLSVAARADLGGPLFDRLVPLARPFFTTDAVLRARLRGAEAILTLGAGDIGRYVELQTLICEDSDEVGNQRAGCTARVSLGYGLCEVGAGREAVEVLREALLGAERLGIFGVMSSARCYLALALAAEGSPDEAVTLARRAAEEARAQGNRRLEGVARSTLAEALLLRGDLDEAEREARLALEVAPSHGVELSALGRLSMVLLAAGRAEEALGHATRAMDLLASEEGIAWNEATTRLAHAESLHASGDEAGARAAIRLARERVLAAADRIGNPDWRASFLERVPQNARTLERARAWCAGP